MPQQLFQVTSLEKATVVELALPHTLDSGEFDELNDSLLATVTVKPEGNWVLDLSRLSYAGSAALGLMVNVRQRVLDAGGSLVLCGLSPRLLQIFRTCCMERLFTIRQSRIDALRAVGG
jgi:anti-anti-sigma factor